MYDGASRVLLARRARFVTVPYRASSRIVARRIRRAYSKRAHASAFPLESQTLTLVERRATDTRPGCVFAHQYLIGVGFVRREPRGDVDGVAVQRVLAPRPRAHAPAKRLARDYRRARVQTRASDLSPRARRRLERAPRIVLVRRAGKSEREHRRRSLLVHQKLTQTPAERRARRLRRFDDRLRAIERARRGVVHPVHAEKYHRASTNLTHPRVRGGSSRGIGDVPLQRGDQRRLVSRSDASKESFGVGRGAGSDGDANGHAVEPVRESEDAVRDRGAGRARIAPHSVVFRGGAEGEASKRNL